MESTGLLESMADAVAKECEQVRADATRKAEEVLAEARANAAAGRNRACAELEALLAQEAEDARRAAETEARRVQAAAQRAAAEEVLALVHERLAAWPDDPAFAGVLDALLDEAVAAAPAAEWVVRVPAAFEARCVARLDETGHADARVAAESGLRDGVIVEDVTGEFRITNTLSSRFARVRDKALRRIVARLRSGDGP